MRGDSGAVEIGSNLLIFVCGFFFGYIGSGLLRGRVFRIGLDFGPGVRIFVFNCLPGGMFNVVDLRVLQKEVNGLAQEHRMLEAAQATAPLEPAQEPAQGTAHLEAEHTRAGSGR